MSERAHSKNDIRQDKDGAQQSSAHTHAVESPTIATPPTIARSAAEKLLHRRIEKFLDFYGLSPMGKSVGLMWIKVGHPSGALQAYFLLPFTKDLAFWIEHAGVCPVSYPVRTFVKPNRCFTSQVSIH